jgi:hypothetical protein
MVSARFTKMILNRNRRALSKGDKKGTSKKQRLHMKKFF